MQIIEIPKDSKDEEVHILKQIIGNTRYYDVLRIHFYPNYWTYSEELELAKKTLIKLSQEGLKWEIKYL